jgi:hypothetical protein
MGKEPTGRMETAWRSFPPIEVEGQDDLQVGPLPGTTRHPYHYCHAERSEASQDELSGRAVAAPVAKPGVAWAESLTGVRNRPWSLSGRFRLRYSGGTSNDARLPGRVFVLHVAARYLLTRFEAQFLCPFSHRLADCSL